MICRDFTTLPSQFPNGIMLSVWSNGTMGLEWPEVARESHVPISKHKQLASPEPVGHSRAKIGLPLPIQSARHSSRDLFGTPVSTKSPRFIHFSRSSVHVWPSPENPPRQIHRALPSTSEQIAFGSHPPLLLPEFRNWN